MQRRITALSVQKRNPNRVNVFLDGEFAFGLSRIVAAWLTIGQALDDKKIESLLSSDTQEVAFQHALKLLNSRSRAEEEIRKKLREHEYADEVILAVVERLRSAGLVNDSAFAQSWVENRSTFRPRSRRAIAFELRRKGVEDEAIEEALVEFTDEEMALQAAQKYARKLEMLDWPDFRKKLGGFLARRGFSYDVVAPVVEQMWAASRSDKTTGDNTNENSEVVS